MSVVAAGCAAGVPVPEDTTAYEVMGARWFDGTGFVDRTMYVAGETLYARRPERVDSVIDLEGAYVIPPLAEAHQHDLEKDVTTR